MSRVLNLDLSQIPEGWFLLSLQHHHTAIVYRGDTHQPLSWLCSLQHLQGGRFTTGEGATPEEAFSKVIERVHHKYSQKKDTPQQ